MRFPSSARENASALRAAHNAPFCLKPFSSIRPTACRNRRHHQARARPAERTPARPAERQYPSFSGLRIGDSDDAVACATDRATFWNIWSIAARESDDGSSAHTGRFERKDAAPLHHRDFGLVHSGLSGKKDLQDRENELAKAGRFGCLGNFRTRSATRRKSVETRNRHYPLLERR